MSYNGYKNWNHWNVSLYINNDEFLYHTAVALCKRKSKLDAAHELAYLLAGQKTPDGATYSLSAIRAALVGM